MFFGLSASPSPLARAQRTGLKTNFNTTGASEGSSPDAERFFFLALAVYFTPFITKFRAHCAAADQPILVANIFCIMKMSSLLAGANGYRISQMCKPAQTTNRRLNEVEGCLIVWLCNVSLSFARKRAFSW